MDQTCLDRSGGLAPISLPLFQGVRWAGEANCRYLTWSYSSVTEDDEHAICAWMPRNDVFFKGLGSPVKLIGLEAGPLSQWLHAVARHPEDVGRMVEGFNWIVDEIVRWPVR